MDKAAPLVLKPLTKHLKHRVSRSALKSFVSGSVTWFGVFA
ncbi:hypothetical protein RD1_4208 [Roseobacter denitrificans OCh 114]|uniref:Uncharacterized protein n=1 Tax=Roseobacter denitrificans (strain ATCC 33942 / OCh 114) TaxID=375451 RepID=Q160E7_ROSDO|nr:hypothetical protein RD1_4208 [Roseobacter denitrificans OCh 114]